MKIFTAALNKFGKFLLGIVFLLSISNTIKAQTTKTERVIFQGFWWDYWNSNYRYGWSNYLCELAPRLRALGFDAIWIPPSIKNTSGGFDGYIPFDMYDLGDKYQKGGDSLRNNTRSGTKDELLRMIAVMHANGIEVVEDLVLNHNGDAGTNTGGTGGLDPESPYSIATDNGYKNFRFVSYATPLLDESQNDYWTRGGRWSKNYENFHPNAANNCTTGNICSDFWGPDIDYETPGAFGQSSNIPTTGNATIGSVTRPYFNPPQSSNYMLNGGRNWVMWFKKQTNVDGYRMDAVKHYSTAAQIDYIYNSKYNLPAWAQGGQKMLCYGEWVGSGSQEDSYVTSIVQGSEQLTGTVDFSLRGYGASGGIYSMVLGLGGYNMQGLPGDQQSIRYYDYASTSTRVYRTVPFVNNHDTYRPYLDSVGNFLKPLGDASGWNTSNELGGNGQHIDPREPRLAAAYATAFAVDGNPCVFFEDIFDIGTTGKRYSHIPTNQTDLPVRGDLQNIIQAHQTLAFKDGAYDVPTAATGAAAPAYIVGNSGDHLVLERVGKAIIGITDFYNVASNNSQDEQVWVTVGDLSWANKPLIDYSGAHGITTTTVQADGRVLIKTAPVGHNIAGAHGHGYSIWAPIPNGVTFTTVSDIYNYIAGYTPPRATQTTQEWEMADDLGDSHCSSLGQGGALPTNATNERIAGRIFVAAGSSVTPTLTPTVDGANLTLTLYDMYGMKLSTISGIATAAAPLTGNYTALVDGWVIVKVRNSNATTAGQRCYVDVAYTAPTVVSTNGPLSVLPKNISIWTGNAGTSDVFNCGNWEGGYIPGPASTVIVYGHATPFPILTADLSVDKVNMFPGGSFTVNPGIKLTILSN